MFFGLFGKKETDAEAEDRIYSQVHENFRTLGVLQALAHLHRLCLDGETTAEECNDLVMGAYRTTFIAAGLGRLMMIHEGRIGEPANRVCNALLNNSALATIAKEIRASVPRTEAEPLLAVQMETGVLFGVAELIHQRLKAKDYPGAYEIWQHAAKGGYRAGS